MNINWFSKTFEISHTTHQAISSMEGIRGFAVFLVFLVHYVTLVEPWLAESSFTQTISYHVRSIGDIGVDLFFVLSGYLIYGMLIRKKQPFGSYLVRRIRRIYPTFTAVFLLYLALSFIFPSESKIPNSWHGLIFIAQNFFLFPGMFDINTIITVSWSLSYEFFCYLLIPIAISLMKLRKWHWKLRVTFFSVAALTLFTYFSFHSGHIRLLMFISGILLFEVIENGKIQRIPPIGLPALGLSITIVIILNIFHVNSWWKFLFIFMLFFIFCLDCLISNSMASKIFKFTPMRWLGNMSYSYYLIHGLTLKFIFMILAIIYTPDHADDWIFWAGIPTSFMATLVPASILFIYIEKPFSLNARAQYSLQSMTSPASQIA